MMPSLRSSALTLSNWTRSTVHKVRLTLCWDASTDRSNSIRKRCYTAVNQATHNHPPVKNRAVLRYQSLTCQNRTLFPLPNPNRNYPQNTNPSSVSKPRNKLTISPGFRSRPSTRCCKKNWNPNWSNPSIRRPMRKEYGNWSSRRNSVRDKLHHQWLIISYLIQRARLIRILRRVLMISKMRR